MKKLPVLLISTFIGFQVFTQTSNSIVDESYKWSYCWYVNWDPQFTWGDDYLVKFQGDTTINQMNYLRIWETDADNFNIWNHRGFIREDTNGYVYIRDLYDEEGLVYRFDVESLDTFSIYNPFYDDTMTVEVSSTDSIYFASTDEYRKRLMLLPINSNYGEEYWIEGYGSLAGIINSGFHINPLTGGIVAGLCQWNNNSLIYTNPELGVCYFTDLINDISDEREDQILNIAPNPLISCARIEIPDKYFNNSIIEIWDSYGRIIKSQHINSNNLWIYREEFSKGLYIVILKDEEENIIAQEKIIVF